MRVESAIFNTLRLPMSISAFLLFLAGTQLAFAQPLGMKFDSNGHPKAKGVWVTLRYPVGWEAAEGERPNIVQKFSGVYNGLFTVLSLQILNAGGPVEGECKAMSIDDAANAFSDAAKKVYASNFKKITHEQKPAFLYDLESTIERTGITLNAHHKVMTICYKNTMISAWCSPSRFDKAKNQIFASATELGQASPLCLQFFNSLVLMSNY